MTDEDRSLDVLLKENRLSDRELTDFLKIIDRDLRYKRENATALYDVKELALYELVSRELERNAKSWKVTQEDWPEIKKSLEDVGMIVEEQKEEYKLKEKVFYGVTIDLKRLPSIWMESYDEAYESALERRENLEWKNETVYIIEKTERYEIVDRL